ncbi:MAG: cellulose-binding protein, partial [Kineosporiaceae bacterium]
HADKALSEAKAEAERNRRAAQRQVDELIRQRDSITGHLDQLRHLLGAGPAPQLDKIAAVAASVPGQSHEVETAGEIADGDRTIVLPADEHVASAN